MEDILLQSVTMERVIDRATGFALFNDLYRVVAVRPNAVILCGTSEYVTVRIEAVGPSSEYLRESNQEAERRQNISDGQQYELPSVKPRVR